MGFLMIIAGIVLLFWNEGRTVKTTRMLKGAQKEYVELGDVAQLHSDLDGKLVHATGLATTDEVLRDNYFGVGANAIKLARKVEYFQWVEHQSSQTRDKVGGGQETVTTYTYSKEWTGSPVNSSTFEDPEYKGISNTVLLQLDDGEDVAAFSAAAVMGKLLQMANGFVYDADKTAHELHEKKLDALDEIISVNPGQPVLVFYNFQADRDALLSRFPDARILDTSQDIEDWNAGRAPMMIAHPASVGHGLNIQEGGHIIVWYGLTWSLELYQQANARLYRQGQLSKTVIIHHLIAEGTVDEQVMQALKTKDTTQSALMRALKERKDGGQ